MRDIWGKIILYLKEHRFVALHVACGDITDVKIEGDSLVITTPDSTVLSMLEDGRRALEQALSWQGKELRVVIQKQETVKDDFEQDEEYLKKMFGNKYIKKD